MDNILKQIIVEHPQLSNLDKSIYNGAPDYKRIRDIERTISTVKEGEHYQSEFRNDITSIDRLIDRLGRKKKSNLESLMTFLEIYKCRFERQKIYSLHISSTNKVLVNLFGSHQNVARIIKLCLDVDLLKCTDEHYHFCNNNDRSYSRRYICNKIVQDIIIEAAKLYNVKPKRVTNYKDVEVELLDEDYELNVAINSKLRLPSMPTTKVLALLYNRYPQLTYYQNLTDDLNNQYYNAERRITFKPNIDTSDKGFITSIGIRAYNEVCGTKAHENGKQTNREWRTDWLDKHYGADNWIEYDVSSSIYRITYCLNHGTWLPNDVDLYEMMYGDKFSSAQERKEYKSFAMRLYFERSVDTLYSHIIRDRPWLKELDADAVKDTIEKAKKQMEFTIGKTYDSEIFLHESCIYLELQKELLNRGFDVTVVYDCFYVQNKMTEEEFAELCFEILSEKAKAYKEKYLN